MTQSVEYFQDQIQEVAIFCKSRGIVPTHENMKDIMKQWIKSNTAFYNDDNRDSVFKSMQQSVAI